jgi:hypothetical protein
MFVLFVLQGHVGAGFMPAQLKNRKHPVGAHDCAKKTKNTPV